MSLKRKKMRMNVIMRCRVQGDYDERLLHPIQEIRTLEISLVF